MGFSLVHPSRLRQLLAAFPARSANTGAFVGQARRFAIAQTLVRAFYAFLLYQAVSACSEFPNLLNHPPSTPLWPALWLNHLDRVTGPRVLIVFYLATNILGTIAASWRVGRVATFLGLLEFVAYRNSFGKIGHSQHLLLYVAGILILLPAGWDRQALPVSRRERQETLFVCWLAQAAILLSYSMSGVAKLAAALYQLATGQPSAFSPGGLSAIVAQRLLETRSTSFFGAWIVHHPYLTWPALPAAIYLETCSFLVAFRPALARPWAAALILFHVGTYFTMTISFPQSCFLLALFFLASPFEPTAMQTWQTRLFAIPLFPKLSKTTQTTPQPRAYN